MAFVKALRSLFLGEEEDYRPITIFAITFIAYLVIILIFPSIQSKAMANLWKILYNLIPAFVLVYILMLLIDLFVEPKSLAAKFKAMRGWKLWLFSVIAGIISTGPIYMWYPLLARLKKEAELNYGYIATFLYARAVKIPLLPFLIAYFGWNYAIAITITIIILSLIEGVIIDMLMEGKNDSSNSV